MASTQTSIDLDFWKKIKKQMRLASLEIIVSVRVTGGGADGNDSWVLFDHSWFVSWAADRTHQNMVALLQRCVFRGFLQHFHPRSQKTPLCGLSAALIHGHTAPWQRSLSSKSIIKARYPVCDDFCGTFITPTDVSFSSNLTNGHQARGFVFCGWHLTFG